MLPQQYYHGNQGPPQSFRRPFPRNGFGGMPGPYGVIPPVNHMHQHRFMPPMGGPIPANMAQHMRGYCYGPTEFGGPNMADCAWLRQPSTGLLTRRNSQMGSFRNRDSLYGSFYRSGGLPPISTGPYDHYNVHPHCSMPMSRQNSFGQSGNFVRMGSNASDFGMNYGNHDTNNQSSLNASTDSLRRKNSGLEFSYSFGESQFPNKNNNSKLPMEPQQNKNSLPAVKAPAETGGLVRHNSITLKRANSATNGFYEFGPQAGVPQGTDATRRLSGSRLKGSFSAPPQWQNKPSAPQQTQKKLSSGNLARMRPSEQNATQRNQNNNQSAGTGELARKGSEKRIGMYFKDLQPTQDGEYKKEGDPGTGRARAAADPNMLTRVRTILLLNKEGGKNIEVDGNTAILHKPNTDEVQKFDTNEIVRFSTRDPSVFVETMDELRDTFLMGCNIGIVMADSDCPAHIPSKWFTWNAVRRLVKDTFGKMPSRSEFTMSLSLLEDDQVLDLLAKEPKFTTLTVAQSPLFGNVPHGMIYQVVESASEFGELLDGALSKAAGREGEERGIILLSVILKQVRTHTPHTKGDEEDIVLSSLFASGVGDGIIHYNRILDKNPAEPRAMFQFALGGPSLTATLISVVDKPTSGVTAGHFLSTLSRLGDIRNYHLRLGSVRRFIGYTKEAIPETTAQLKKMPNGREKAAAERSLARLQLMLSDAESMLKSPDTAVPRTYIRN